MSRTICIFILSYYSKNLCKQFITYIINNCNTDKLSKKLLLFYGTIKYNIFISIASISSERCFPP